VRHRWPQLDDVALRRVERGLDAEAVRSVHCGTGFGGGGSSGDARGFGGAAGGGKGGGKGGGGCGGD
jgi:hypothetical protein